jgi:hypothetical protein
MAWARWQGWQGSSDRVGRRCKLTYPDATELVHHPVLGRREALQVFLGTASYGARRGWVHTLATVLVR